ncbi:IS30 family transposase [Streptomyces sp. ISL-99]|uniref:IS30 family transposase n=1 Tax=Streptomyces sp. ISL-99 TaxID=2819193 RepID=UPI001BE9DC95|nr:IS30 family transposase [Streptomyces sp. ISL-99]MBT2526325.1 IS30 family transposase [Streptomyces sp. ISL-99]
MAELTRRSPMKSPGRPSTRREIERLFWGEITKGLTSEDAAVAVGAAPAVGTRWFRHAGGMPQINLTVSGRYLSFAEREEIALLRVQGAGIRDIAGRLGRSPSTISRELRRNAATRGGRLEYRASVAQWKADLVAGRPKEAKLAANERLREYVQDRLLGVIRAPDGRALPGPQVPEWKGRNKPHRNDRQWANAWSPEQISARLKIDFPEDESMRISHEAIYQALYVESRGGLKRELVACLRTGRALRVPRARSRSKSGGHVTAEVLISQRPAEATDRAVPGHWEGDLIIGLNRSAVGTLVERTTRYTMLVHLPRAEGYGTIPRTKNGPALAGYGAVAMKDALATTMATLPDQLRRSLTWDRGKELSAHAQLTVETGLPVYFADPHSPWQRATNENTNGLLRQYFPKGTDLSRWGTDELTAIAAVLNSRPRKTLGWKTPAEALDEHLQSAHPGVATTG